MNDTTNSSDLISCKEFKKRAIKKAKENMVIEEVERRERDNRYRDRAYCFLKKEFSLLQKHENPKLLSLCGKDFFFTSIGYDSNGDDLFALINPINGGFILRESDYGLYLIEKQKMNKVNCSQSWFRRIFNI